MSAELVLFSFVLFIACAGTVALFLRDYYRQKQLRALIFKGTASLCFLGIGAISCFSGSLTPSSILIFVGLCFGLVGDEVIHLCQLFPERDTLFFVGGGSLFLVGHLLYIPALLLCGVNWIGVAISFTVMVTLGLIYERKRSFLNGKMKIPLALYLGIVSFMGAVAVGAFVERLTLGAGLFALGGVLFTLSDNILFAYKLGKNPKFIQNILLHAAYYSAQLLIAVSIAYL